MTDSHAKQAGLLGMRSWGILLCIFIAAICQGQPVDAHPAGGTVQPPPDSIADKPLFRDPIHDGAADPVVIWNRKERKWFMLYTNRRANVANLPGVSWVHGTKIGIAESENGAKWTYRGTASIHYGTEPNSHWAPDVFWHGGRYHMFLTYVPGMHNDWGGTREIVHLTSDDLINWDDPKPLKLSSNRVIDACVMQLPDQTWRMWYNNEPDHKAINYADSKDLKTWIDRGKVVGDQPGEGPKVFKWKGRYWMIVDLWQGLGVYHSEDAKNWTRQKGKLVSGGGIGADDNVEGRHADVLINQDRAYLFYFTHPGRKPDDRKVDSVEARRSSIQVVELIEKDGQLTCDRNSPTRIHLVPPESP